MAIASPSRFSRPIVKLTEALRSLADGNFRIRVPSERTDEIGLATEAFNRTAAQLEHSRDRLVNLTQLASWQVLARKTAHEVKNSLTPIRLTVEEMVARHSESNRAFLEQAAAIVVDEVESLERRVRAFSEFSAEPDICPAPIDVNSLVEERIAFLKNAHPEVSYVVRLAENTPNAMADEDLVKGILVNLLENAAEAAGDGGRILAATSITTSCKISPRTIAACGRLWASAIGKTTKWTLIGVASRTTSPSCGPKRYKRSAR